MKKEEKKQIINIALEEYLNTPEKERSLTKIGRKYGVKRQTLSKYLKEQGVEVINYQNRCRINENVFDIIDTEEKAYWLGFIYADGNISSVGHRFEINLSAKDLNHMLKLKKFLNYEGEIRIEDNRGVGYEVCRLAVRNKNLWEQLNSKGCTPCKSLTLEFPKLEVFANYILVYDFIRGYCDGDGSLGVYEKEEISFVGTKLFLQQVENILDVQGCLRSKSTLNYTNQAYSLHYSSLKARVVARKLYENANIYMDRKYNLFIKFCQREEESSLKKSSKNGKRWNANTVLTN